MEPIVEIKPQVLPISQRLLKLFKLFHHKHKTKMNGLKIKTADVCEADINIQSLSIDKDGKVTLSYQKTLVDTNDNTFQPDGDVVVTVLAEEDAAGVLAALSPVLTPLVTTAPAAPTA